MTHQFSISQLKLARTCLRKWYLRYIAKATPDYTEDSKALVFGRIYHSVIENGALPEQLPPELSIAEARAAARLAEKTALSLKSLGFRAEKHELYFTAYYRGYEFRGYVDAVGYLDNELAFAEFKTTSQLLDSSRLIYDLQVLFYAYFSGLNASRIIYHQAVKPTIRQTKAETEQQFAERFANSAEERIDIIPTDSLAPLKDCEEQIDELLYPCVEVLLRGREPKAIYTSACQSFGKPCEFWSHCFGCNRRISQDSQKETEKAIEISF